MTADRRGGAWAREARHRAAAPTRLGLTLRSVLVAPRDGYVAALRTSERRARAGERPAEGFAAYVLALLGGAATMALWLKLGAFVGRRAPSADLGLIATALVLGALVAVTAQFSWGSIGALFAARLGGEARPRDLRVVWGAAALPQVFGLLALAPLDLAIAGAGAFAGAAPGDPVARAWVALSMAIALALAGWSMWLFVRGSQVASGLPLRRALGLAAAGGGCLAIVVASLAGLSRLALAATTA